MLFLLHHSQTQRLHFEAVDKSQFETWLPFFEDPRTHQHWNPKISNPTEACNVWYARQQQRYDANLGGMNALIEKHSGKLVGYAGLLIQTVDGITELEIAYSLLPEFWGQGFALEAAAHCRDIAFKNKWRESLISIISITNVPSQRVALKNGLEIAKNTVYSGNDVYIFKIDSTRWQQITATNHR